MVVGCEKEEDLNVGYDDPAEYKFLLTGSSCYGVLPKHIANFLLDLINIDTGLDRKQLEAYAKEKWPFRAVAGKGKRPDFVAELNYDDLWVRTLEGPDPETTVYMVYGAGCAMECGKVPDPLDGFPLSMDLSNYRLFRVVGTNKPQDVTHELMPQTPRMTPAERRRYGPHIREKGDATEANLILDVNKLQYFPVLRWFILQPETGDYYPPPIPVDDPRRRADSGEATFGFLVWNGRRFELHDDVPDEMWSCTAYPSDLPRCNKGNK